ncbi:hypothetical protein KAFR_0B03500 [Kazachstania africana CBS 2517]|uniref:BTB domain-containing protein n=1 Tax=Kazachstania africana (strain ATCC 22294 / BCRC 22015 / CBS 2517 / CECT 1963 / NBRC 1671 / NRRL Y-8276) TaxID=1071382 RepID=H2AQJ7_KAZAF|nr:hypothetical protein KAFR_0B03500 [Kazachstania africana CBS 2517]CCF56647.1 hypothetical protein KAFR_0B03500 [Kazachstania africana CBS 2517]
MPPNKRNDAISTKRDIFGRDISYLLSCLPTLEKVKQIDLYSSDAENGYTPLHVSLKNGHLRKAFKLYTMWKDEEEFLSHKYGGNVLNQKDREGLTPIELYNAVLQVRLRRLPKGLSYKTSNSQDLTVEWNETKDTASFNIKSAFKVLPKNGEETKILRENGGSHLLNFGSNVHYQLGTGAKDDRKNLFQLNINQLTNNTELSFTNRIKTSVMTRYHSLLTTSDGRLYVCGNSARGRLGHGATDKPLLTYTEIPLPETTTIRMLATSDSHSILLVDQGKILTWGWNSYRQLGYQSGGKFSEEKSSEGSFGSAPKRVHFFDDKDIKMVACSNVHSCALTTNNMLYIWGLDLGQMGRSKSSHLSPDAEYMGHTGHIVSNPHLLNLSHLKIEQIICTEFATFIRSEGNVLQVLSNHSTRVFRITMPKARTFRDVDVFNHFTPREISSKVMDMKCSNSYGNNLSFRYECGRIGIISSKAASPDMWTKLNNTLPITIAWVPNFQFNNCLDFDVGSKGSIILCTFEGDVLISSKSGSFDKVFSEKLVSGRALSVSCDSSFGSFSIIKNEVNGIPVSLSQDDSVNGFNIYSPLSGNINDGIQDIYQGLGNNKYLFDVEFVTSTSESHICYCHKFLLKSCCTKLMNSLENYGTFITNDGNLLFKVPSSSDRTVLKISVSSDTDPEVPQTMREIVHFLYTDQKPSKQQITISLLGITESSLHGINLTHHLNDLLKYCFEFGSATIKSSRFEEPDTIINLKDGNLYAHSPILAAQSAYFLSFFGSRWYKTANKGYKCINMDHYDRGTFTYILKGLYGVSNDNIFEDFTYNVSSVECLQLLLDLLLASDELLLLNFKTYLESKIINFINSETLIAILMNASYCNATLLLNACCWFLVCNISILFTKDIIPLIKSYFTEEIWNLLESSCINFDDTQSRVPVNRSWYEDSSKNWIKLFEKDIKLFNEEFVGATNNFKPLFDLKKQSGSTKEPERRRSSTTEKARRDLFGKKYEPHTIPLAQIASSTETEGSVESFWSYSEKENNNLLPSNDAEHFTKVTSRTRRKSSGNEVVPIILNKQSLPSEVVFHMPSGASSSKLPSLMSSMDLDFNRIENKTEESTKLTQFKKDSQKQRRKLFRDQLKEDPEKGDNKHIWNHANDSNKSSRKGEATRASRKQTSLPSLLDTDFNSLKKQTKKNKKKGTSAAATVNYTEFVSTGNPGGIRPYITASKGEENEIANVFGNSNPSAVSTLEERLAAQEFEKWFAQESAKVQKKLKKKRGNAKDEMQLVYSSSSNMPEMVDKTAERKPRRKLKGKFPSKHKSNNTNLSNLL